MDLEQIRNLSDEELKQQIATAGESLFRIRFQKSMGNLEGVKHLREHKVEIARVKTIQRERVLTAERLAAPSTKGAAPAPSERTARKKAKGAS